MLPKQRRKRIFEIICEEGYAKVQDLSKLFNVTDVTIRQDLEILEREGYIEREHGGAFLKDLGSHVKNMTIQTQKHTAEKEAIAVEAVKFISEGDTIILDSGSTTTEVAKKISGFRNLTVITNSLNIALILGNDPGITLVVTGGEFKAPTLSLSGQKAADFFQNLHVDKLFLGTAGISFKSGLTYPTISDICVKKAMIDSADTVFLVADSSKIGVSSFASLGALSLIHYFITDNSISDKNLNMFRDMEIKLVIGTPRMPGELFME